MQNGRLIEFRLTAAQALSGANLLAVHAEEVTVGGKLDVFPAFDETTCTWCDGISGRHVTTASQAKKRAGKIAGVSN